MKRFVVLVVVLWAATGFSANMAHSHLKHVYEAWGSNPNGVGFMPLAFSELSNAQEQMVAISHSSSVTKAMFGDLAHSLVGDDASGAFGVTNALSGMVKHTALSAMAVDSTKSVVSYADSIATCANNAIGFAEEAAATAQQIQNSSSSLKRSEINALAAQVAWVYEGRDLDGDGVIAQSGAECGLRQADVYMSALKHLEGLE